MEKIDAIIFDIDGTMVDVSKSYLEAIRQTSEYFLNRPVTSPEVAAIKALPGNNNDWDATFALISQFNPMPTYEIVKTKFQDLYLGKLINNEKLLIKPQLLERLSKKYILGIVTGRPQKEALFVLNKFAIYDYFCPTAIICMEDTPQSKPDPAPLLLCQTRLGSTNSVYIGDSINDKLAATSANMHYLQVGVMDVNQVIDPLL